jgi:hypothetical protein
LTAISPCHNTATQKKSEKIAYSFNKHLLRSTNQADKGQGSGRCSNEPENLCLLSLRVPGDGETENMTVSKSIITYKNHRGTLQDTEREKSRKGGRSF